MLDTGLADAPLPGEDRGEWAGKAGPEITGISPHLLLLLASVLLFSLSQLLQHGRNIEISHCRSHGTRDMRHTGLPRLRRYFKVAETLTDEKDLRRLMPPPAASATSLDMI